MLMTHNSIGHLKTLYMSVLLLRGDMSLMEMLQLTAQC